MHPVVRNSADPTSDTGGGESTSDCCGAYRRWFVVRGGHAHGPGVDGVDATRHHSDAIDAKRHTCSNGGLIL